MNRPSVSCRGPSAGHSRARSPQRAPSRAAPGRVSRPHPHWNLLAPRSGPVTSAETGLNLSPLSWGDSQCAAAATSSVLPEPAFSSPSSPWLS